MNRTRSQIGCLAIAFALDTLAVGACCRAAERPAYVSPPSLSLQLPSTRAATQARFRKELARPVPGVSWKQASLRDALSMLQESYGIAILLDRRIDPTIPVEMSMEHVSLEAVLDKVAKSMGADVRLVGHCVYLAPPEASSIVRTLVALKEEQLASRRSQNTSQRQIALRSRQTARWADVTDSQTILKTVADRFDLTVENPERLPHDVWRNSVLTEMSSAEMLSLVLIQFELTFEWRDDLSAIRLVPLPEDRSQIVVKKIHRARRAVPQLLKAWREVVGDFQASVAGREITVLARVEQHEQIDQLNQGKSPGEKPGEKGHTEIATEPTPLDRRKFTLRVTGVSARAVMNQLEQSGISFAFDAEALGRAKVDLETPVSMDVEGVGPAEFFEALFGPLSVTARFSGTTVRLEPAKVP